MAGALPGRSETVKLHQQPAVHAGLQQHPVAVTVITDQYGIARLFPERRPFSKTQQHRITGGYLRLQVAHLITQRVDHKAVFTRHALQVLFKLRFGTGQLQVFSSNPGVVPMFWCASIVARAPGPLWKALPRKNGIEVSSTRSGSPCGSGGSACSVRDDEQPPMTASMATASTTVTALDANDTGNMFPHLIERQATSDLAGMPIIERCKPPV